MVYIEYIKYLAELDCGLDKSPTVIVGEATATKNSVKIGAY
jgi:hypothetical protein